MEAEPEMVTLVKALADAERLRIIGALVLHNASLRSLTEQLGIPLRAAVNHVAFLEYVGIIRRLDAAASPAADRLDVEYQLDTARLESVSRQQFIPAAPTGYVPAPDLGPRIRKVLTAYLNADGSLRQIPTQSAKLQIILDYLITAFSPGVDYTEKEVNMILRRFNLDTAALRRYLVDAGMLCRESNGARYWRPA